MARIVGFIPIGGIEHRFALVFDLPNQSPGRVPTVSLWKCLITKDLSTEQGPPPSISSPGLQICEMIHHFAAPGNASPDVTSQSRDRQDMSSLAKRRWEKHAALRERHNDVVGKMMAKKFNGDPQGFTRKDAATEARNSASLDCLRCNSKASLGIQFLDQCWDNMRRLRPCYTDNMYKMAMLLYFTSAKAYKILRQIVVLPAVSSLYRNFHTELQETRMILTDPGCINDSIAKIKSCYDKLRANGVRVNNQFTLAVDAFAFRSFSGNPFPCSQGACTTEARTVSVRDGRVAYRNGFLFLLIAHDYRIPTKVVHLACASTGSYTSEIGQITESIIKAANGKDLRVICRATDGDPGVSSEHQKFYQEHIAGRSACFRDLLTDVHQWLVGHPSSWIPISDPLHIFKNIRARILKHRIRIYPWAPSVDIEKMRTSLKLGAVLEDRSQLGKMRDCYVLSLFTFANVVKLLKKKQYVNACILFPFSCWIAVIYGERINLGFRIFLVELAFQVLSDWFSLYDELEEQEVARKYTKDCSDVVFTEPQYVKRMLNTLVTFGVVLFFGADNIRLDALGTHLVENAIGIARSTSHDPRYECILATYVHNELRKRFADDLGITIHIPGRVNSGGCKVDPDHQCKSEPLSKPKGWRVDTILQLLRGLTNEEVAPALKDEALLFQSQLSEIAEQLDTHQYSVNEAANSTIMARLIKFASESR